MNFLNPAVLFGLFAIAIPILIHLLNLRKIRKVEFSTLMFLKEIQKSKMRRIKLKQLLLLLLRILAIVFLILSFANPVYEGFAGNSDNFAGTTTLIFLDDSFSMSARDNNGQYLNQAKEAVKKILQSHRESDNVYFIPVSFISLKNRKILFNDFKELTDSMNKVNVSYKLTSMDEILNYSDRIFKESHYPNKEIFIISDFQNNNFNTGVSSLSEIKTDEKRENIFLIKTGKREINNLSLDSFNVVSKLIENEKDIKIQIYLNNHSQYNVKNKTIGLYINNELKDERVVDINSYERKPVEFIFKSDRSGYINGMIELVQSEFSDDEIIQDNKYYFSLYIPDRFNIGLLDETSPDMNFIKLALQTATSVLSDSIKKSSELFRIENLKAIDENIYSENILFIAGKKNFTDNEANILKDYISNGGGVFLFLGNNADIDNYNNTILNKLNFTRISKLDADKEINQNLKFDRIDFENPLLSEIFLNQKLNITAGKTGSIESPLINSYFELIPGDNSNSIITLTNTKPFLLESKISKGKIIISSVSASNDMSDLPLKSIFVPLIIRSIYYLGNDFSYQKEYVVGNSNIISVRNIKNISGLVLPDKEKIPAWLEMFPSEDKYLFLPYSEFTLQPGKYTAEDSSGSESDFSMNFNSLESSADIMKDEDIKNYFKKNGYENIKLLGTDENISEITKEARSGISLWKYFLIIAIIFTAAEMLLSKKLEDG